MAKGDSVGIEELLGHADWLQRLARHLVGADADDLAQEVWLAAHRRGPDPGRPARPWLSGVLRNLGHARRRDEGRRLRRERAYQDTLPSQVSSIDAAYERLALQRLVAEQVMALDESLRAVVVLRYFEGLDSAQIARLTGTPEGTVRWRIKTALDRLRATLDARHGGRRHAWAAVLAPGGMSPPKPSPPATPPTPTAKETLLMASTTTTKTLVSGAVALAALLLLSIGLLEWGRRSRAQSPIAPARGEVGAFETDVRSLATAGGAGRGTQQTGAGGPRLLAAAASADLAECRSTLERTWREAEAQDRSARASVPSAAFESGASNPRLQAEVASQIAAFWTGALAAPGLTHEVECRDWACRLTVTAPGPDSDEVGPWLEAVQPVMRAARLRQLKLSRPSPRGITLQVQSWDSMQDARSARLLEKYVFFFGAPADAPQAAGTRADLDRPTPPAESRAECEKHLEAARQRKRARAAELAGFAPLADRFVAGAPATALTSKVRAAVQRAFASQPQPAIECRDAVCQLQFEAPPDEAALARLGEDEGLGGQVQSEQGPRGRVLLTVARHGWDVLSPLLEPARKPGFFAGCPEPERAGKVLIRLHLPSTGRRNDEGTFGRVSLRVLSGALANTPAGVCLVERIGALVTAVELPDPVGDLVRLESWSWTPGHSPQMRDQ